jgi:hypothetical protein
MVNGPAWARDAARLMALPAVAQGQVSVGLHLNLSEGQALTSELQRRWPTLPALPRLILLAHLHLLPKAALLDEPHAQWACFERLTGRVPDHLDGHQHVHHLPALRTWVLGQQARHPALRVRDTGKPLGPGFALKRALIAATGGRTLSRQLQVRRAAQNRVLLGAYDFEQADYRACMQAWLAAVPADGALLFCHPGLAGRGPNLDANLDVIAPARLREHAYLASKAFADDLLAAGVALSPKTPSAG